MAALSVGVTNADQKIGMPDEIPTHQGHLIDTIRASVDGCKRQRLSIVYFTRNRNERSERVVSPQRLVHYKENWYLIALCHKADGLRMFALDAIEGAPQLDKAARSVVKTQIDEMIGRDFGIYSGEKRLWAKLHFSPAQARWVEAETWHPEQKSSHLDDGGYLLEIPYGNPRELILEILRLGPTLR